MHRTAFPPGVAPRRRTEPPAGRSPASRAALRRNRVLPLVLLALGGTLTLVGCVVMSQSVEVEVIHDAEHPAHEVETQWRAPTRVYLTDGSLVVLPSGGAVGEGELMGRGTRYSLTLDERRPFARIPLDSVIAIEAFRETESVHPASLITVPASLIATGYLAAGLAVAIFGSCPTIYAIEDGSEVLEMEAFSHSIAPLMESRDVARIGARPDSDGILRLELRNEALETHYIRNTELLVVDHTAGERVASDPSGQPVITRMPVSPLTARDGGGRDVLPELLTRDDLHFRTAPARLAAAATGEQRDRIDLLLPVEEGESEVALHLRLRNTLLTSVLFYDVMLGESGAAAIDWIGRDLDRIGTALELGTWAVDNLGMRVLVEGSDGWEELYRVPDTGPIAWKELVIPLPAAGPTLHVRLEFLADAWMIDYAGVAGGVRRASPLRVPVERVLDAEGRDDEVARSALAVTDTTHFVTFPGQRRTLEFAVPVAPEPDRDVTYLLAMQGYYVEWVRGRWLAEATSHEPFRPGPEAIPSALRRWIEVMDEFERDFHATRIPVR
jgi:hypothetical protein